jgi:hypothetical protein
MNRAVLTFNGERRGIAAWLAAPAPMGALEYLARRGDGIWPSSSRNRLRSSVISSSSSKPSEPEALAIAQRNAS